MTEDIAQAPPLLFRQNKKAVVCTQKNPGIQFPDFYLKQHFFKTVHQLPPDIYNSGNKHSGNG